MKRRWLKWLAALFILSCAILDLWLAYAPLYKHHEAYYAHQGNYEHYSGDNFAVKIGVVFWALVSAIERHHALWIVLETFALVGFTATLWWSTRQLQRTTEGHAAHLESSADAAQKSANAAALTARNMLRTNRPLCILDAIFLTPFEGAVPDVPLPSGYYLMSVHGNIVNKGTTVAFARDIQFASRVGDVVGKPIYPSEENEVSVFSYGELRAGSSYKPPMSLHPLPVTDDALQGREGLFVWGWLRYSDIHGIVRRSGFAFRWSRPFPTLSEGHFGPCGPSSYWYDVEENPEQNNQ